MPRRALLLLLLLSSTAYADEAKDAADAKALLDTLATSASKDERIDAAGKLAELAPRVHSLGNLTTLCHAHHTALHEGGQLIIRGTAPGGLEFLHADGRPYGTEPEYAFAGSLPSGESTAHGCAEPPESSMFDDALSALTNLGFKASVARAAVERASAHVCVDASLEELIRAALKECAH
jgi:Holliday junction resolvase RuvA-like protein